MSAFFQWPARWPFGRKSPKLSPALRLFEQRLGYRFQNPCLLLEALTHSSYLREDPAARDQERLEFLGDAVLSHYLADALSEGFPEEAEGFLARARSALARGRYLEQMALDMGFPEVLRMSEAELQAEGNYRPAALEDALEAVIGAIYRDRGWVGARRVLARWYADLPGLATEALKGDNPKGKLQELVQQDYRGSTRLYYELVGSYGPGHERRYKVAVKLGERVLGIGEGHSKKVAQEQAAVAGLKAYQDAPKA